MRLVSGYFDDYNRRSYTSDGITKGATVARGDGMSEDRNLNDSPNLEDLLQLGIQTARAGNKANARMIFEQVLAQDQENERAWLWMAAVAETPTDRIRYLNTVLRLNPNNAVAKKELERIRHRLESSNTQVIRYGLMGLGVFLVLVVCAIGLLVVL